MQDLKSKLRRDHDRLNRSYWISTGWFLVRFLTIGLIFAPMFFLVLTLETASLLALMLSDWIERYILVHSDTLERFAKVEADRKRRNDLADQRSTGKTLKKLFAKN